MGAASNHPQARPLARTPLTRSCAYLARLDLNPWAALAIALLVFAPLPILVWLSPVTVVTSFPADIFTPLDAAWRWHLGQLPGRDFHSPIGVLYFAMHGVAFDWLAHDAREIMRANLLVLPVVLGGLALAAPRRLNSAAAMGAFLLLGILAISPHYFGWGPDAYPHLASYDRHAWVLLGLALLLGCTPSRGAEPRWRRVAEGVALGAVLAAVAYLKATAALTAGGAVLAGAILLPERRATFLAAVLTAAAIALAMTPVGVNGPYVRDLLETAQAGPGGLVRWGKLPGDLRSDIPLLFFWGLALAAVRPSRRMILLQGVLALLMLLTGNQNHQHQAPLLALLPILLVEEARRENAPDARAATAFVCALLAFFWVAKPEAQAIYNCWSDGIHGRYMPIDPRSDPSPVMKTFGLSLDPDPDHFAGLDRAQAQTLAAQRMAQKAETMDRASWRTVLLDGLAALQRFAPGRGPILALTDHNPYPAWTGTQSPKDVALWWDVTRTLPAHGPAPRWFTLQGGDVVLVPAVDGDPATARRLLELAAPELARRFVLAGQSRFWDVYVRKPVPRR